MRNDATSGCAQEGDRPTASAGEDATTRRRQEDGTFGDGLQLRSVYGGAAATGGADGATGDDEQQLPAAPIPKEQWKTLLALVFMLLGMLLTAISIATVHERVPDAPPLPDVALNLVANVNWALSACELLLVLNMTIALAVSFLHRHRWVVLRRIFLIVGLIFIYRAITMSVTVLPAPNYRGVCLPKSNHSLSFAEAAGRVTRVAMWGGFTVGNSRYLCGDTIFSGHTASLTLSYLAVRQYSPPAARSLHWISLLISLLGFIFLLLSHGHYTVDLIIGYWLASRLWMMLHTLAESPVHRRHGGHLTNLWWFPIFNFLEANVPGRLPCELELPWDRGCFRRAYQRLGSFRMRLRNIVS